MNRCLVFLFALMLSFAVAQTAHAQKDLSGVFNTFRGKTQPSEKAADPPQKAKPAVPEQAAKTPESPKPADTKPAAPPAAPKQTAKAPDPAPQGTEEAVIQRVKHELALLPASIQVVPESIKADLDGRAVICENVAIKMSDTPDVVITVANITVSGIDAGSYAGSPGDMTEAETLSLRDIRFIEGGVTKSTMDEYAIEGLSFAYRDVLNALQENKDKKTDAPAPGILSYLTSYKAKLIRASGFKMSDEGLQLSIDSLTSKDSKFSSCGPASLRNVHVDMQEQRIFSLEELSLAGAALPEIVEQMALNPASPEAESFLGSLMTDPLSALDKLAMKELSFSNLRINFPQTMPVALAKFVCDLRVENGAALLTGDLRELSLAVSQLPEQNPFPVLSEAVGGQDLLLNSAVSLAADSERKVTFSSSLQEKQKGDISLGMILTVTQDFDVLLHEAECKAKNGGIVDLLLGVGATIAGGEGGYTEFQKTVVAVIQQGKEAFTDPGLIDGSDKLIKLIQDGGSFRFALRPGSPLDLNSLGELLGSNPAALGHSFEYTAPATPKKR